MLKAMLERDGLDKKALKMYLRPVGRGLEVVAMSSPETPQEAATRLLRHNEALLESYARLRSAAASLLCDVAVPVGKASKLAARLDRAALDLRVQFLENGDAIRRLIK